VRSIARTVVGQCANECTSPAKRRILTTPLDAAKSARPPGVAQRKCQQLASAAVSALEEVDWDYRFHLALDNCTDVSIFLNERLLDNVHQNENAIKGHKCGSKILFDTEGRFMGMAVLFSKHASANANAICEYDLEEACETFKIPDWSVRAVANEKKYYFVLRGKRYILDIRKPQQLSDKMFKICNILKLKCNIAPEDSPAIFFVCSSMSAHCASSYLFPCEDKWVTIVMKV
jgi:hypothetical protein